MKNILRVSSLSPLGNVEVSFLSFWFESKTAFAGWVFFTWARCKEFSSMKSSRYKTNLSELVILLIHNYFSMAKIINRRYNISYYVIDLLTRLLLCPRKHGSPPFINAAKTPNPFCFIFSIVKQTSVGSSKLVHCWSISKIIINLI